MSRKNRLNAFAQYAIETNDFDLQRKLILTYHRVPKRYFGLTVGK